MTDHRNAKTAKMNTLNVQPPESDQEKDNMQPLDHENRYEWFVIAEAIETALKEQRARFLAISTPLLMLLLIAIAVFAYAYNDLNAKYSEKTVSAEQLQDKISTLQSEANDLKKSMETLMAGKLPGLVEFKLNTDVEINKKYLKHISFYESTSTSGRIDGYQCRTTLFNEELSTITPEISVTFFNKKGFVIGYYHIGPSARGGFALAALKPNQKRSDISEIIRMSTPDNVPAYFLAEVN